MNPFRVASHPSRRVPRGPPAEHPPTATRSSPNRRVFRAGSLGGITRVIRGGRTLGRPLTPPRARRYRRSTLTRVSIASRVSSLTPPSVLPSPQVAAIIMSVLATPSAASVRGSPHPRRDASVPVAPHPSFAAPPRPATPPSSPPVSSPSPPRTPRGRRTSKLPPTPWSTPRPTPPRRRRAGRRCRRRRRRAGCRRRRQGGGAGVRGAQRRAGRPLRRP